MRKLAAIMFTDIEGFTKLMQHDESQALQLLERHRKIYAQYISQFKGRIVKYMGDGTLTIFSSAIQAVKCAVALQQALQKKPLIPVRIGIHQGDVILENKDVIGDAVNLASRVQMQGVAGSVVISEKVYDELQNHEEISVIPLGSFELKNISHAVNLYAISADGLKIPPSSHNLNHGGGTMPKLSNAEKKFPAKFLTRRISQIAFLVLLIILIPVILVKYFNKGNADFPKTIAVLPFENISENKTNYVLADGLTEEMISLLSANKELTIKKIPMTAINSHQESSLGGIFSEIKAGSVLEGKVEYDKDSLFIFVNLRNTSTNQVIWSDTYRREFRDLMKVQEEVAQKIANALNISFNKTDIKNFVSDRTYNSDAYLLYMQGRYALNKRTQSSMEEAIFFFNKALQEDSNFALAYSGIGDTYTILIDNGYISYDSGVNHARDAVNHAFSLDSASAEIRASKAIFLSTLEGKHVEALKELRFALEHSPNYAAAHQWYALELAADGQFDSAIMHIDKAMELEPFSTRILLNKSLILQFARRYQDAISLLNYSIARFPDNIQQYLELKIDCQFRLGQTDSVLISARNGHGPLNDYEFWQSVCSHDKTKLTKYIENQASLIPLDNGTLAAYYVFLGQNQKALDYIEDAYSKKEFSWLKYLNVSPTWDALRKEGRFNNMLAKLGFK